jgi:hypothetical protein
MENKDDIQLVIDILREEKHLIESFDDDELNDELKSIKRIIKNLKKQL